MEPEPAGGPSGPQQVDERIARMGDWRGDALGRMRRLIKEADPDVEEDVKWRKPSNAMAGVAVWSHGGMVCTGETYKSVVKLTFAKGAALQDPARLFNAGLGGGTRRAIDIREGEEVDAKAFKALFREAVALNTGGGTAAPKRAKAAKAAKPGKSANTPKSAKTAKPPKRAAPRRRHGPAPPPA